MNDSALNRARIIIAVIMFLIGICLVIWPGSSLRVLVRVVGGLLILGAVAQLIAFIIGERTPLSVFFLIVQLCLGGFGGFLLAKPDSVISFLYILLGASVILSGAAGIFQAFTIRRFPGWLGLLFTSIIVTVLGIVIIRDPFGTAQTLIRFVGIVMIFTAIVRFAFVIGRRKHMKELEIEVYDATPDKEDEI